MLKFIVNFIESWLGALPSVIFSFLGVLVCVLVVSALWDRRMKALSATLAILVGLGLSFNTPLLDLFSSFTPEHRLGFIGVAGGVLIIAVTIFALRQAALQHRYVVFWLGCGIVLIALSLNEHVLQAARTIAENPVLVILGGAGGLLIFLFGFHLSLAISRLEKRQRRLRAALVAPQKGSEQVCMAEDDADRSLLPYSIQPVLAGLFGQSARRQIRGSSVGAPLVIIIATLAVIIVGLATPQAMIGDEVTHYYMLVKQGQDISVPNFYADIPLADGGFETRRYPHSFGWHYLGALVYLAGGLSFASIQFYQAAFFVQLLIVAFLLARSRGGVESRAALLYVLILASLPLCLIFSVAFYQDVPMTAQALTAFYLLRKRRWFIATLFMSFALWIKVTAVLFFPVFFLLLAVWEIRRSSWLKGSLACGTALVIVLSSTWILGRAINVYGHTAFYPQEKMQIVLNVAKSKFSGVFFGTAKETTEDKKKVKSSKRYAGGSPRETDPVIIANHPGDLRVKQNYLIYGGILIWGMVLAGGISCIPPFRQRIVQGHLPSGVWLSGVGGAFLLMTAYLIRSAPDARFFLPALPFLLLPIIERVVQLPKAKIIITIVATLAFLQGGYVLKEAYALRAVPNGIREGIAFLETHPPSPKRIFMYPEGNYRLFPCNHEWYLGYRLRDFWRTDNDERIRMFHRFSIGAIVIKKRLIATVDEEITNLGVYPTYFVKDIRKDPRFVKVFENDELVIYSIPPDETFVP